MFLTRALAHSRIRALAHSLLLILGLVCMLGATASSAWAGKPSGFESAICAPDGVDVCAYGGPGSAYMICNGVDIDDDEDATSVDMVMVYDSRKGSADEICDGKDYCAWGTRTVGTDTTEFFCAWTDDSIPQAWLVGTSYDDTLSFHYEDNLLWTLTEDGCSDSLIGVQHAGGGADTLHGSWHNNPDYRDELRGQSGADVIYMHSGNDSGTGMVDQAYGEGGADVIWGGGGDDIIFGGDGNDRLMGLGGDDTIYGGDGDDVISGGEGDDTLNGDADADTLCGQGGDSDLLFGGESVDVIHGGTGDSDVANCGPGAGENGWAETVHPSCEASSYFDEPTTCWGDPDAHAPYGHADDF